MKSNVYLCLTTKRKRYENFKFNHQNRKNNTDRNSNRMFRNGSLHSSHATISRRFERYGARRYNGSSTEVLR